MLEQRIENDMKEALKAKQETRLSTLRFLRAALKNARIEKMKDLTDDDVIAVIKKQAKQRNESIEEFKKANRPDLAEKEANELEILKVYLPQELGADQVRAIVKDVITETKASSIKDMGLVMKEAMARAKGAADGKALSAIVKEELSKGA